MASGTAILVVIAFTLASVAANDAILPRSNRAQASRPASTPAQANKTYTLYSGLWRTDGSFVSTIRIKNVLVVAPMDVTPVLFMADGTPYMLSSVHVAVSGVATISVNDALAAAPSSIASHVSQFGSASLIYSYPSPGHVSASMAVIDAARSLSYTFPFSEPMGDPMAQILDGLWWKHDPDVTGWIALSNVSDSDKQVSVQLAGPGNDSQPERTVPLAAHSTQMFHLQDLAANPSTLAKQAGGIHVQYTGQPSSVLVTGGLENDSEGYSANIPFWGHAMSSATATSITYASAGLMIGKPDPTMMPNFPKDTTFTPYLVIRNTTEKPLDVGLQISYMVDMSGSTMEMGGSAPVARSLPAQHLGPREARQVDMQSALNSAGLKSFNGTINLSSSFTGKGGDLLLASGSVDQTGTYVFEVEPQAISTSRSIYTNYWGVSNGNDTMFSLWNPTDAPQDILATFYYGDGSGKYTLPVHLEAQASTMIDMAMLIAEIKPDADGNVIPPSVQEGSAQFGSAKGRSEKITLIIAAGIYNVSTATCGGGCIQCCGDSNFGISPNPIFCPIGETMPCSSTAVDCNGYSVFPSSWSSSNTAVMTVDGSGNVHGVSAGSATITANFLGVPVYTGQLCSGGSCPSASPAPQAPAATNNAQISSTGPPNTTINLHNQPTCANVQVQIYHTDLTSVGNQTATLTVATYSTNPATGLAVTYHPPEQPVTLSGAAGKQTFVSQVCSSTGSGTVIIQATLSQPSSGIVILAPSPAGNAQMTLTVSPN